ncbi:hypothetical protein [Pseudanabaena sp. FACHB-2040]|uniref:hypothetical protein n=1 Tax=Pseudanabaena sp. FACHB-2040 TaxID=2692859 RepID=UPI001685A616|nr:hypothetical protein [Pseudanabaena sp. FACHB-2040]MBD2257850.1 hypothetical protein [Pseudanabaena sp. FACHB-2040]
MAAFNDQWQAARQLRQEIVAQRRQQVYAALDGWQQERFANAAQLRQALNQLHINLQDETALWLAQARQHRLTQAQVLRQKLAADQQELEAVVSDLRLEIAQDLQRLQRRVANLRQETASLRAGHRQAQAMLRSQLLPELEAYVTELKTEVAAALNALTIARHAAAAPRQEQRQQQRQALAEEVEALFHDLADFRQGLRNFRAELTAQVWGQSVTGTPLLQPAVVQSQPQAQAQAHRHREVVALPTAALTTQPVVPAVPPILPTPMAVAVPLPAPAPEVAEPKSDHVEELIYNYLHKSHGARLTEIESELGISRFQAVDALRSLIQKELIVQEDRIYHVQEEAVL